MDTSKQVHLSTIKTKVDALMDILFGAGVASHSTIIEQINYLLFLRALTKKDDDAIAIDNSEKLIFFGELSKYRWDNLLMLNTEDLFNTLEEIYRKLPNLINDRTINLLYRDAHIKIFDKPTLRRFLHEIENMMNELEEQYKVGHNDIFGEMYEYLLSKLAQAGTMGSFRTPRHIIKFIVDVIDPKKGETILDPACGTAGFLVAALEHLKNTYTSEDYKKDDKYPMDLLSPDEREFIYAHTFTGFDSDSDMIKFGLMNLYLHHLEHPQIIRQNTLVDTAGDRTKWDVILANPPFAGAIDKESISEDLQMGTRATEILFLRYMIDHLSEKGRAGIIVPEGIIFSNSNAHQKIRKMLIEDAGLWCVVSLPPGVFNPYAGVKTSIVFFDKTKKDTNDKILFVKITNDGFSLGAQRQLISGSDVPVALQTMTNYKDFVKSGKTHNDLFLERIKENEKIGETISLTHDKFSVVSKKLILNSDDVNLSVDRYKVEKLLTNQKWPLVKLKEISEKITKGTTPTSVDFQFEESGVNFIKIESIDNSGKFINKKFAHISNKCHEKLKRSQLKEGDILFSIAGALGRVALVKKYILPANTNQALAIITPTQKVYSKYLEFILRSDLVINKLENLKVGVAQYNISLFQVSEFEIPLPPLEIQKEIVEELDGYQKIIDGAKLIIDNWKPKIEIDLRWEKVNLPSISKNNDNKRKPVTKSDRNNGKYPYYGASGIVDYVDDYIFDGNYLLVSEDGANLLARSTPIAFSICGKNWVNNHAHILKFDDYYTQKFVELYINQTDISNFVSGMAQPKLNQQALNSIQIPLPEKEIQKLIVVKIEDEQTLVSANLRLVEIFEQKIKDKIAEVWGEKEN